MRLLWMVSALICAATAMAATAMADDTVADRAVADKTVADKTVADKTVAEKTVANETGPDMPPESASVVRPGPDAATASGPADAPSAKAQRSTVERSPRTLPPARWTKTLATTPDFTQTDVRAKLPGAGHAYCGPVAVANSFVQLARTGYPRLAPLAPRLVLTQIDIVQVLAADSHMATCCRTGTSTAHLVAGIERYVRERGYRIKAMAYRGWRPRPRHVPATRSIVDLPWIKAHVAQPASGAWLNVGWYVRSKDGAYRRTGGHWVTLSGYGIDKTGASDARSLILRDPSPRSGSHARFEFASARPALSAMLLGPQRGLPRPSKGMLRLHGLAMPAGTDLALIDGVVVMHLDAPKNNNTRRNDAAGVVGEKRARR